jgi:hypothetical protein
LGVLALALGQLVAAVVLPAADGHLDVEKFGMPVHVESHGDRDCMPHHDHTFCQVMRATSLATPARASAEIAGYPIALDVPAPRRVEQDRSTVPLLGTESAPRAPPRA